MWPTMLPSFSSLRKNRLRTRRVVRKRFLSEILEPRTLLTAVSWDGGGGDFNWNNPLNWSADFVPGAADDVSIGVGENDFTVVHASGTNSVKSLTSYVPINVSGGKLLVSQSSSLLSDLTVAGVFGGSADIRVGGLFKLDYYNGSSYGILQGVNGQGSLTANGGTKLAGYGALSGGFRFVNPVGQTVTVGGGQVLLFDQSQIDNYGTFHIQGGNDLFGYPGTEFNNFGVVRSDSNGHNILRTDIISNATNATINVQSGRLILGQNGAQLTNDGSITAALDTTLEFQGKITSTGSISSNHVVWFTNTAQIAGTYFSRSNNIYSVVNFTGSVGGLGDLFIDGLGVLDVSSATLTPASKEFSSLFLHGKVISPDDLSVSGLFTLNYYNGSSYGILQGVNGQGSLTAKGGTKLAGYGALRDGFRFVNPVGQTVTVGGGQVLLFDQSQIDNYGTFHIQGGNDLFGYPGTEFNNFGVVRSDSSGHNILRTDIVSNATNATINVQSGRLILGQNGAQLTNDGSITAALDTTLEFQGKITSTGSISSNHVVWFTNTAQIAGTYFSRSNNIYSVVNFTGSVGGLGDLFIDGLGVLDVGSATLTPASKEFSSLFLHGKVISPDDLSVSGLFTLNYYNGSSYGILQGVNGQGSLTAKGGTKLAGYGALRDGFRFVNPVGQTVTVGGGQLLLFDQSQIDNYGTFHIQGGNDLFGYPGTEFNNFGVVRSDSSGHNILRTDIVSNATNATINVQSGRLILGQNGAQLTNDGSITAALDTILEFQGKVTSTGSISADHVVWFTNTAQIAGTYFSRSNNIYSVVNFTGSVGGLGDLFIDGLGVLDVSSATLTPASKELASLYLHGKVISPDDLSVSGLFTLNYYNGSSYGILQGVNGQGSLTANGGTKLAGYGALRDGFRFVNPVGQTVTVGGGQVLLFDQSQIDNYGTFHIQGGNDLFGYPGTEFNNFGVVRSDSNGHNILRTDIVSNATNATINVQSGRLILGQNGAQLTNDGSITSALDTTLEFQGKVTSTGSISSNHVVWFTNTAQIAGTYFSRSNNIYSVVNFTGSVGGLGALFIDGLGVLDVSSATLTPTSKEFSSLHLYGKIISHDDLIVIGIFKWDYYNGSSYGVLQGVNGHGSLTANGGMTVSYGGVSGFHVINAGTALWGNGNVQFTGDSSFTNTITGTFINENDNTFGSVDTRCIQFKNDGQFVKSGKTGTTFLRMQLYNRGSVEIQQGQLFLGCGYVSTSPGNPIPPGIDYPPDYPPIIEDPNPTPLPPTSPPVVIPGSYTQTVTGKLIEQIAGHSGIGPYGTPGTDYGQMVVNGDLALNGSFEVQIVGGFIPTIGQKYLVIDNRGIHPIDGTFIDLAEGAIVLAGIYGFKVSYVGGDGNDFVLTMDRFANTPPIADVGGPYSVAEGSSIPLSAENSSDAQQGSSTLIYLWDLDDDGIFGESGTNAVRGDENGIAPIFSAIGLDGPSSNSVTVRVIDEFGVFDDTSTLISILNVAPTVTLIGPVTATEGSTKRYSFTTSDPGIDTFEIIANDGGIFGVVCNTVFDPVTGEGSFDVKFTDGSSTSTVSIQLKDSDGAISNIAAINVAVTNVAPTVNSLTSSNADLTRISTTGNVTISGAYTDPAFGFDTHMVRVNWGDGSPIETLPAGSLNQSLDTFAQVHHYTSGGIYSISVTVLDEDGGVSAASTTTAVVSGLGLVNGTLYIIGTEGSDEVEVEYKSITNQLTIEMEWGEDEGCDDEFEVSRSYNASTVTRIVAWLLGGDDEYESEDNVFVPQIVFGGAGNDEIQGGSGNDALIGGLGNDVIKAGLGRDLLIGGAGRDVLKGEAGDDLLIGGSTANGESPAAIDQALAAWSAGNLNAALLQLGFITDDLQKDDLSGDLGTDALYGGVGDRVRQ